MKRKKKNSTIRESELGVLKWFHDKWLNHETPEKVQFYLWLEADYMEHLKQYTSNRDTYFSSEQKQNRSEAFVKLVIFPITGIGTLLAGANVKSIW